MQKAIRLLIPVILLICPLLLWGNRFIVGGDDSKLYYAYPELYIKNFALNLEQNNTLSGAQTGYQPLSYFIPLLLAIKFLKFIPILNPQMILYGINLSLGYLGFLSFLKQLTKKYPPITSGLLYITSSLLGQTLYAHQLPSIYLVGTCPWILFFLLKSVEYNKKHFAIISAAIASVGSSTLLTLPWSMAFIVGSLPLFIWMLAKYKLILCKHITVFVFSFLVINTYWIAPYIDSQIFSKKNALINSYSGQSFINENVRIVAGVSNLYQPINIFSQQLQPTSSYLLKFILSASVCSILIIKGIKKNNSKLVYISFLALILNLFLISPGVSSYGVKIFIWLTKNIPFWGMFRNMYDKFSLPLSFWFATCAGIAIQFTTNKLKKVFLTILSCLSVLFSIKDYIPNLKLMNGSRAYFTGNFSSDFVDLVSYLSKKNDGRVMWLPLNYPAYSSIQDSQGNIYYGPSPLREMANIDDFTGRFSFLTSNNVDWGNRIISDILKKDYSSLKSAINLLNIKYIIINNLELNKEMSEFFYGGVEQQILSAQNGDYIQNIVGEKITSFGNFDVYKVSKEIENKNPNFVSIAYSSHWISSKSGEQLLPRKTFGMISENKDIKFKLPVVIPFITIISLLLFIPGFVICYQKK